MTFNVLIRYQQNVLKNMAIFTLSTKATRDIINYRKIYSLFRTHKFG